MQARGRTVQGVLSEKLRIFLKEDIKPTGSGRTDTGVHALAQYANFFTLSLMDAETIAYKLNRMLPPDIAVTGCAEVPSGFNARRDAGRRTYRYLICERLSAINRGLSWVVGRRFDIEILNQAARVAESARSFHNFCKVKSRKRDNACRIYRSCWSRYAGFLRYEITANRFLHNMVRYLVGAMTAVSDGRENLEDFKNRFGNSDNKSKYLAPPHGLYLANVEYEGIKL